jgi:quercetin dioxygenase-like cupin family protein
MQTNPLRKKLVLVVGLGVVALCGVIAYAATFTILAAGTMPDSQLIGGPATFTFRNLLTPPGEVGAWHYHPGKMFNVVKRGTVTVEDGCGGGATYSAGQAFEKIGGRVHRAINPGAEECEEYNLFINPQGTPLTMFIPNNERRCGPAREVEECKNGGWTNFNHPTTFSNQGECITYVKHQR